MSTILIVDDMAIFRDPIAASLRLAGYKTLVAKDGAAGLQELRTHHPDLVLLDIAMPVLDGMSFLRAMRREPALKNTPVILLTALADKKFVIEAAKMGVRDYLLKSRFSLAELCERIKKLLSARPAPPSTTSPEHTKAPSGTPRPASSPPPGTAAGPAAGPLPISVALSSPAKLESRNTAGDIPMATADLTPLMNSQQCVSRVEACMAGKTLSGAVAEVLMLASRPSAELKDLSALITRDPVLSVRVLQMANSAAFFSRRGSVTTITEAVKNIGANNVRNIAASVGIFDAMPASSPDGFNPIRCWQHSFAVARLCESFVIPTAPAEAGVAYLVGLCHDLGEIMFRTQFDTEYRSVLDEQQRSGAALEDIERRLLGMTHTDILKVILKCMGLPESIRNPIEQFQKNPGPAGEQPVVSRALALAENYANGLLLASSESSLIAPIPAREWTALSGKGRLAIPDGEEFRAQVYCLTAILSRMNSADLKSPYKKAASFIWLARDPVFCSADPLGAAIEELAGVEIHDRLPTPAQLARFSALAIEGRRENVPGWSWPDIENSRSLNPQLPLLWLTSEPSTAPPDFTGEPPVQAVSLRTIQAFIGQAELNTHRAAA